MHATYLDWAATAPLSPAAAAAMAAGAARLSAGEWANPSSVHAAGRAARRALETARETVAAFLRVPPQALVFTSGGTEALAIALAGARSVAVGATEHAAVHAAAPGARLLSVDASGLLDPAALDAWLASAGDAPLVAVQHANNETGVVQDLAAICARVHAAGGRVVADCVQSAGKLPLPPADFIAVSAHKLGGPAGVGALVVRCRDGWSPPSRGGGQEDGARGGTENLLGILGFAAAVSALPAGWLADALALRERLERGALALGASVNGAASPRLPTIASLHRPGVPAATQLMALDMAGVMVSQGAACSSGTMRASPTLAAMGLDQAARESIRVSLGWSTTGADIDAFLAAWGRIGQRRAA